MIAFYNEPATHTRTQNNAKCGGGGWQSHPGFERTKQFASLAILTVGLKFREISVEVCPIRQVEFAF